LNRISIPTLEPVVVKPKFTSVKDCAVATDQNLKFRKTMEDKNIILDKFQSKNLQGLYCIFDGHGGKQVVDFVTSNFVSTLDEKLSSDPGQALEETYSSLNEQIMTQNFKESGCTAVTALMVGNVLYIANIGDTNAILRRNLKPKVLTVEHNAFSESEAKRIQEMGGVIIGGKILGVLSTTRAFGDLNLKPYVITDPYIKKVRIAEDDTHLILACDGLWDVVPFDDAIDEINREIESGRNECQHLADHLKNLALTNGSTDNITVIVIEFNKEKTGYQSFNLIK